MILLFLIIFLPFLSAESTTQNPVSMNQSFLYEEPWMRGPLITPGTEITKVGHVGLYPYISLTNFNGFYDKQGKPHSTDSFYSTVLAFYFYTGITSFLDFGIAPRVIQQSSRGEHFSGVGDLPFAFSFQLINKPSLMLSIGTTIPLGKYQNLNPNKKKTDELGVGSWLSNIGLSIGQPWKISPKHTLSPQLAIWYVIPSATTVQGFNVYGGGYGTKGTAYPGNIFWCDLSFEYNFTQRFGCAIDIFYTEQNKTSFSGKEGILAPGIPAKVGFLSSYSFSLATGY